MTVSDPTVFVVEGNPQTRSSLAAVVSSLGLTAQTFTSASEFLSALDISRPGCAVVDSWPPDVDGIQLHRRLRDLGSDLPVILIGTHIDVRVAAAATEQGVFRVVEYPCRDAELSQALREAIAHDRKIRNRQMYRRDFAHRLASLDARERLALKLIVSGRTGKAIQHRLGVATRTMDRIRASILRKMNVQSFMELSAEYGAFEGNEEGASAGAAAAGPPRPIALFSGNRGVQPDTHCPDDDSTGQLLACDLHDGAAQYLTAGLLRVQAILNRLEVDGESVQLLRDAEATLSLALGEIRDLIDGQSPNLLRRLGLVAAIENLFKQLAHPRGIAVEFVENLRGQPLPSPLENAAYRIVHECLNNALRHSGSQRIRVEVMRESGTLRIQFRDWGRGFALNSVPADRRGLQGIYRRVELLHGRTTIKSQPDAGTVVTAEIPLAEQSRVSGEAAVPEQGQARSPERQSLDALEETTVRPTPRRISSRSSSRCRS